MGSTVGSSSRVTRGVRLHRPRAASGRKTCLHTCAGHARAAAHPAAWPHALPPQRRAVPSHRALRGVPSGCAQPSHVPATSRQPGLHPWWQPCPHLQKPDPLQGAGGASGLGGQTPEGQGPNPQVTVGWSIRGCGHPTWPLAVSVRPRNQAGLPAHTDASRPPASRPRPGGRTQTGGRAPRRGHRPTPVSPAGRPATTGQLARRQEAAVRSLTWPMWTCCCTLGD